MRTIAISIDEGTLAALDRMAGGRGRRPTGRSPNRSAIIRRAVREFIERGSRQEREERDRRAVRRHRERIEREARALVGEQAEP